jgi:endothelin-converting enzyme/putative endopeptidase
MLIVSGLTLPEREYYLKEDERSKTIRAEYLKYVAKMFELTGVSAEEAKKNADLVMAFETKLATARMNIVDRRDPNKTYNKTDEKGLTATAPSFNWKALLDSTNIPVSVAVNVMDNGALKGFEDRLKDTSIEDWKVYLKWKMLAFSGDSLSKPFRDEEFRFNQSVLRGVKEQKPRWQTCAAEVDNALGEVLGQEFVKKYFPPAAKQRMSELVSNLQATLSEEVEAATWLTADTKKEAKLKLESFLPKIGYPSKWRDYSGLKIDPKDYFANAIAARKFDYRYNLEDAGKPVDRKKWQMTPPTVNAYYSASNNEIVFPAGILQPPFFDMNADDAFNYGAIGAVIGHEMGHGFDDQGSKFDSKGNLRNWWTDDDRKKFEERAACIVDQFDNIDVGPGLRHNGRLVTGEALGDVGGLTLAYKAYKRALRGKPEPPVIEGYTADQRFFLSFARVWAVNRRPEAIRMQLQTDPHPIAKYRANGTLADMPEFQKAFHCKAGDPMVRPAERQCKLW